MEFKKWGSIFKSVVVFGLSVIFMGGSNLAIARTDEKQPELGSTLADSVSLYLPAVMKNFDPDKVYSLYLPAIMKNFDPSKAYQSFLPLILKQEIVIPPGEWDVLMTETFEDVFPDPADPWEIKDITGSNYMWAKRDCEHNTTYGGGYSAWAVGGGSSGSSLACGSHYPDGVETWMIYGPFSLVDYQQAELVFYRFLNMQFGDEFKWMASINGLEFYGEGTYAFEFWKKYVFDLTNVPTLGNLAGESQIYIAFVFKSNNDGATLSHGAYVDDIVLHACDGSCTPTASAFPLSEVHATSDLLK